MENVSRQWELEIPTIKELLLAGRTVAQLGDHYGFDRDYMRTILKRLRRKGLLPTRDAMEETLDSPAPPTLRHQEMTIQFPDKPIAEFNYRTFLKTAIDLQRQKLEKEISQKEATIKIYTDKPFAISFTSDWHLGSPYTDYEALLRHIDLWLSVPNLYLGTLGDITDNFILSALKSGALTALFSPLDQHDVAKQLFSDLSEKVLFTQSGNHENWTSSEAGMELAQSFYSNLKAPYLREGGGITLVVNDLISYRLYVKHRYRFHSNFNVTNSGKRMHDMESPFDIGVLGHYHVPTFEHTHKWSGAMQRDIIYIMTGSYKVDDKWTREMGLAARGTAGCPTVIFFPNQKKMIPFRNVEDAAVMLQALQQVWTDGKTVSNVFIGGGE